MHIVEGLRSSSISSVPISVSSEDCKILDTVSFDSEYLTKKDSDPIGQIDPPTGVLSPYSPPISHRPSLSEHHEFNTGVGNHDFSSSRMCFEPSAGALDEELLTKLKRKIRWLNSRFRAIPVKEKVSRLVSTFVERRGRKNGRQNDLDALQYSETPQFDKFSREIFRSQLARKEDHYLDAELQASPTPFEFTNNSVV